MRSNRHGVECVIRSLLFLLAAGYLLQGCSTMSNGKRWGEDATPAPGWQRVGQSACDALTSPAFLVPAAGALLLRIGKADEHLSDWAMDHTPVFGSMHNADKRSEDIASATSFAYYTSVLATPGGEDPKGWAVSKAQGLVVQGTALGLNGFLVDTIKDAAGRERPNHDDDQSFPSGTAAKASSFSTLASRNVDAMNIPQGAKTTMNVGLYAMMCASAWGRVEAGAHYPTDVLAGVALSYFVSAFINDAFMGIDPEQKGSPVVQYNGRGLFLGYQMRF